MKIAFFEIKGCPINFSSAIALLGIMLIARLAGVAGQAKNQWPIAQ